MLSRKLFAFAQKSKLARIFTRPGIFVAQILVQIKKSFSRSSDIPLIRISKSKNRHQVLFDITCLINQDHGGGIQRVQKSLLKTLLENSTDELSVRPIYFSEQLQRFEYATPRQIAFLGQTQMSKISGAVMASPGDLYLNTDLNYQFTINRANFYADLQKSQIKVFFIVYDILPLTMPRNFPAGIADLHRKWLEVAARHSHLLCISRTVQENVKNHFSKSNISLKSSVIRLGNFLSTEIVEKKNEIQNNLSNEPLKFLVVSTLEPRKNHNQILEAFEILWAKEMSPHLVFVGKKGWDVDQLVKRIRHHPELGKKLFWYDYATDEDLGKIYLETSALINASQDEGFGLPILEAASLKIPLILRNIPVFQEVAGSSAWYFDGDSGIELAESIIEWMAAYLNRSLSVDESMSIPNWTDTAMDMLYVFDSDRLC